MTVDPRQIGTPVDDWRVIDQRECRTKTCSFYGQRWDARSNASEGMCPAGCGQEGKPTGVTVHVGDAERHLEKHGRVVDVAIVGGELP